MFEPVTNQQLQDIVLLFKNTSAGFNGLSMKVSKDNIDILCLCITHICNISLSTGVFPRTLMISMVFSKILEKIVVIQIVQYFTINNLYCKSQFGIRKRMSTEGAVLDIVNELYYAFDRGETVIGVFLDLSKAFDTLNRELLYRKLEYYDIRGNELRWFRSCFNDCRQLVRYGDAKSDVLGVNYGVAQGSVLYPILYSVFVNDFVLCSDNLNFTMYANNTCVFSSGSNLNDNIASVNVELNRVGRVDER